MSRTILSGSRNQMVPFISSCICLHNYVLAWFNFLAVSPFNIGSVCLSIGVIKWATCLHRGLFLTVTGDCSFLVNICFFLLKRTNYTIRLLNIRSFWRTIGSICSVNILVYWKTLRTLHPLQTLHTCIFRIINRWANICFFLLNRTNCKIIEH